MQLKVVILEQLNLESKSAHVTAMALAWGYQPYIDASLVKELVAGIDSYIADTAPSSASAAVSAAPGSSKPKRKKKKKPTAAAASGGGETAAAGEEEDGDDGPE
jgi:hypothetical protein